MSLKLLLIFLSLMGPALGAKILVVSMLNSKSVKNFYSPLYLDLAKRGHHLTIISPFKTKENDPHIRDIVGTDILASSSKDKNEAGSLSKPKSFVDSRNVFQDRLQGTTSNPLSMTPFMVQLCRSYYSMPEIQRLMKEESFDLILATYTFNECGFGLVHHFKAPYILLHANVVLPWNNPTGLPYPLSFIPLPYFPFTDRMGFWDRVQNYLLGTVYGAVDSWLRVPQLQSVYQEFLPDAPDVDSIARNVSLILTNSHHTLNFPRPLMADVIEVGGMHCRPAQPLPSDLNEFLNSSGDAGFIFFSLGSIVDASTMPESFRKAILKAFARLDQKILWKWETEEMEDLPPNVKLSKWLPQQDVLAHPKIRLFITHGGLHSIEEAIYHAVPLVGIPLYGDQDANMRNAEHFGFAVTLDLADLTEESLFSSINSVLQDERYTENAGKLSTIFKDRLDKPLEKAVFWTEYILRHEGAHHLRSYARELRSWEYNGWDVASLVFVLAAAVLFILTRFILFAMKLFKIVLRRLFSR